MVGVSEAPVVVTGEGQILPGTGGAGSVRFELRDADFSFVSDAGSPLVASYRDVTTIAVDHGRVLLHVGSSRLLAERLGDRLGTLVATLRDRRARQLLTDRLIDLPRDDALEMAEFRSGDDHGVAQLAYHPWGVALIPLDERQRWRLLRRADIERVSVEQSFGRVRVDVRARPSEPDARPIELLGLGAAAERERGRIDGLRAAAVADAAAIIGRLAPALAADQLTSVAPMLVDGRPSQAAELGASWGSLENAVLGDPTYAATYAALRSRSPSGAAWLSLAPKKPEDPTEHMAWFFVALPNDLVAFELVSEGSHATYLFRAGGAPDGAVYEVSESLIDTRFLREPIYMTDAELAAPENQRYRYAIAELPSLRAARSRFVRRLIHTDEEAWAASLDEAIQPGGT
jgi:hypothetical protein